MKIKHLILLVFYTCFCLSGFSQEEETKKDSLEIYRKIEEFSEKRKITRMLHNMVFKPTSNNQKSSIKIPDERNYKEYEGKIIRRIIIETLDPFGYSVYDSLERPRNWLEKTGNHIHKSTNLATVRDLLLIEENLPLDILLLKESERLIRSQEFVRSVLITAEHPDAKVKSDSVDLRVRVLDSWSIIPEGSFSTTQTSLGLIERNFIGTGHQFRIGYTSDFEEGRNGYHGRYIVPNFKNTFIRSTIGYRMHLNDSYYKGINVERTFYSPFTRWAGGVYVDQQLRKDSLPDAASQMSFENRKYNTYDVWGGHSFRIFPGMSENDRTTNLITSARMLKVDFKEKPSVEYDSIGFFSDETFSMGSIGIASRQYVEDMYVFNYGIVEDVPVGTVYGLTTGYQRKNQRGRLYLGGEVSIGNYFSWGFLSTSLEAGSFFRRKSAEQVTLSFQANYFTNLINIGTVWKMRQFVKPQLLWGINRLNTIGDRITLNEHGNYLGVYGSDFGDLNDMGLYGFRSPLYGTQKALLTLQTQFYAPWNLIGFRLNPFLNYSVGVIGDENRKIHDSRIYSSIGAGFIISNDYLVFNTFQVSFAFYPQMPGRGENIFRTNSFHTSDFGFQDFEFGKPRPVLFK